MILVLDANAKAEQVSAVLAELERRGLRGRALRAGGRPVIHVLSGSTRRTRRLLARDEIVALVPTSGPRVRVQGRRFYPYHFLRWSAAGLFLAGALVFLAGLLPPGIGLPIDPKEPPPSLDQPWYVRVPLAFIALFPEPLAWVGWIVLLVLSGLVVLLPAIDRSAGTSARERWPVLAAGVTLGLVALGFALRELVA